MAGFGFMGSVYRADGTEVRPYDSGDTQHSNKRKHSLAEEDAEFDFTKRQAREPSHTVFSFTAQESEGKFAEEEPMTENHGDIIDEMHCSEENHPRTIDQYFRSIGGRHSSIHSSAPIIQDANIAMVVSLQGCTNCQQNFCNDELINCSFCQKSICNFCDSTCRRCGQAFCRNCSTTLYTQYSEDLVCLDCFQEVHCIS